MPDGAIDTGPQRLPRWRWIAYPQVFDLRLNEGFRSSRHPVAPDSYSAHRT